MGGEQKYRGTGATQLWKRVCFYSLIPRARTQRSLKTTPQAFSPIKLPYLRGIAGTQIPNLEDFKIKHLPDGLQLHIIGHATRSAAKGVGRTHRLRHRLYVAC